MTDAAGSDAIVTGEAVALDLRAGGIGSRSIAFIIDATAQIAVAVLLVLLLARLGASVDSAAATAIVLVGYVLIVLGYPVAFETLNRGRTPGKAALGLRVVRDDGGPIRFRHAFVRGLVGVVLERPGMLFFLPALGCMLINRRSKRVGDLAAGTVVVLERVPAHLSTPPVMPGHLAAWAATLDLTRVDDAVALRVRRFLGRAPQLSAEVRAAMAVQLGNEVAARTASPPAGTSPTDYLAAVVAERRRREEQRLAPAPAAATRAQPDAPAPSNRPTAPRRVATPPPGGGFTPPG